MQRIALLLLVLAMTGSGRDAAAGQNSAAAIEAARRGGVSIACRHGITDGSQSDAAVVRYDDITTQRRLSAEGEAQSIALGRAFRDLHIPAGDVIASPMQRARRMAELMFGRVIIDSIWYTADDNYGGPRRDARARALAESTDGDVRIIISHQVTLLSVLPTARGRLEEGTCVVVRPSGSGFDVVGIVPWNEWIRAAESEQRGPAPTPQPAPQIFAPGIVSTAAPEFAITFTPDGRTAYFNRMAEDRSRLAILETRLVDGEWSEPVTASFSGEHFDVDPFITPDGSRLYFNSDRPAAPGDTTTDLDSWYIDAVAGGWTEPRRMAAPISSDSTEVFVSATRDGTLYFRSNRSGRDQVWAAAPGREPRVVTVGTDSAARASNPLIHPDGDYLIVVSGPTTGADLFLACREGDDFGALRSLGPLVNSPFAEFAPGFGPGLRHLYFTSERPGQTPATQAGGRPPGDIWFVETAGLDLSCG